MAKNIILEHEEVVQVVNVLNDTNISPEILEKFQIMMDRENKDYYKVKKGIVSEVGFYYDESFSKLPLDFTFKISKATNIRDYSKNQYQFLNRGNYYITRNKTEVFAHKWQCKLYGLNRHLEIINKKIKSLKTEKGKLRYVNLATKVKKRIKFINDHPEKLI